MSEFWKRKIRTYFGMMDLDKDGVITQKDFEQMAERFCEAEKADAEHSLTLRNMAVGVFRAYFTGTTDGVVKGDEVLTEEIFIESMKKIRDNPEFQNRATSVCRGMFKLMDTNKDGYIKEEEHRLFFEEMGLDTAFTKTAFQSLDTDGDGVVNLDELLAGYFEFLRSEDENNKYTLFFGSLVPN